MDVKQRLVTAEELEAMPEVPGKGLELVDGELVEMSPAGFQHGLIAGNVYDAVKRFVRQHDFGVVQGDNVGYVLRRNPDQVRVPDVSFVAWKHAPEGDELDHFAHVPPTLAVEIVSPNDRANVLQRCVQDYLQAGTQLVWVLWPETRSVTVHHPDGGVRQLGPEAQLDGGDVLPGFSVRVGVLFDIPQRSS